MPWKHILITKVLSGHIYICPSLPPSLSLSLTHTHTTHTHLPEDHLGHCPQQVQTSGLVLQVTLLSIGQEQGNLERPMGVQPGYVIMEGLMGV